MIWLHYKLQLVFIMKYLQELLESWHYLDLESSLWIIQDLAFQKVSIAIFPVSTGLLMTSSSITPKSKVIKLNMYPPILIVWIRFILKLKNQQICLVGIEFLYRKGAIWCYIKSRDLCWWVSSSLTTLVLFFF